MDYKPSFYSNRNATNPSYRYKKNKILWLNSAYADDIFNTNEFYFKIRPTQIFNNSILKPVAFISASHQKSFNIFRIKNISYDVDSVIMTDKKEPILLTSHNNIQGHLLNDYYSLTLKPQQINDITIINERLINKTNYFSYSPFRQYPSKTYNSFTTPVSTTFNDRPSLRLTITLNNTGITYGDGTYNIWVSSTYGFNGLNEANLLFNLTTPSANNEAHWATNQYSTNYTGTNYLAEINYKGDWVVIQPPKPFVLTFYEIYRRTTFPNRAPKNFKIYGSYDSFKWDILDTKTNITYTSDIYSNSLFNKNAYNYYGMVVSSLMGAETILNFNEWALDGYELLPLELDNIIPDNWFEFEMINDLGRNTGKDKTFTGSLSLSGITQTNGYKNDYAVSLNGTSSHLTDPTYKPMGNQSFTFSCWSNRSSQNTDDFLFSFGSGTTANTAFVGGYLASGQLRFTNFSLSITTATTYLDANKWVFLTFTFDNNTKIARIYYNGDLIAEAILSSITPDNVFYIGRFSTTYYHGTLADVRIYYKALTPSEVSYLYNQTNQNHFPIQNPQTFNIENNEVSTTFEGRSCYKSSFVVNNQLYEVWYSSIAYVDTLQNRSPLYLFDKSSTTKTPNFYFNNYDANGNFINNAFVPTTSFFPDYLGDWIIIKYPFKFVLKSFNFIPSSVSPARSPKDYRIYGSNNGLNWELIIDEINVPATEYTTNNNYLKSVSNNTIEFSYYLLIVNKLQVSGTSLAFQEWILRGEEINTDFLLGLEIEDSDLVNDNIVSQYK